jgi:hypothetical protein
MRKLKRFHKNLLQTSQKTQGRVENDMKETQISHRHHLKNKLIDQASIHDDAMHGLRKHYVDRTDHAETKLRL